MEDQTHVSAIICEYNPFHNGHAYHIQKTRKMGATHIVAVMSGNFVQRGSCALLSKWSRAEMALQNGVDLVVELPLPWAIATAQRFASGAVSLIHSLGCIDSLSFGSECGDKEKLIQAAQAVNSARIQEPLQHALKQGLAYAVARDHAITQIFGIETAKLLRTPNNALGVEYLRALNQLHSDITPIVINRKGAIHDQELIAGKFTSASYLRKLLLSQKENLAKSFLPAASYRIYQREAMAGRAPAQMQHIERAILAKLRSMTAQEFSLLPDLGEGLEYRIAAAVKKSCSLEEVFSNIKTKRYTHARIRRIILSAYLGVVPSSLPINPPYIRVLGFNNRGIEILKRMKHSASLPVIQLARDLSYLKGQAITLCALEDRATDLYGLATPKIQPCGKERTTQIIRL